MELMINTLLLSFILFMVTPTSQSICVARHHNSSAPSSHSHPHDPPPLSLHRASRPTPSPPPPPQSNTPIPSRTTSFHTKTRGTTQLEVNLSDASWLRARRPRPSPPPPPQRNHPLPSETTSFHPNSRRTTQLDDDDHSDTLLTGSTGRLKPSPPPPAQRNIPTDSETTSFHPNVGTPQLDDLGDTPFTRSTLTVDPRLKRICNHTDYPSLCLSSLSPSLASCGKTLSFSTALSFAIKAATQHARLAIAALARLVKAPGADEDAGEGLGVCKDSYSDALDNLQAAVDALSSKDVPTANSMLSAVVTDSQNCGDALEGTEAGAAMTKYNDKLRMLASNCLAIASFVN